MTESWILLRGLTRERRHWGDFPATFLEAVPDARVIALDLPGNGELNGLASPLTVDGYVAQLRAELARRGIAPPYHLLGLSLGAMVAVAWSVRHPQEIRACVLINTSLRPFSAFYRRLVPANYATLAMLGRPGSDAARCERHILRITTRLAASPDAILREWVRYRRERPVSAANALRQLVAAARYRAPAAPPVPPVLLLAGRRDALVAPRCSRDIARHWHCRLVEHPDAGHDLPLDDGPWVARQVRDWLGSAGGHAATTPPERAAARPSPAGALRQQQGANMTTRTSTHRRLLIQGMFAAVLAGCAGSAKEHSTGDYVDDSTVTTKVKAALLEDPVVSGLAIQVETFKGTVQLSGFAKTDEERSRAASVAREVGGVQAVKNDIIVR